ncbi:flagellar basal body L-ring protein FlgH [Maribrevibacterium harenarium]|uniref:Flagellar L-ring protein n=1 Tax=Maribrevibacterium harenarium TaxID=2589817 RepID=A0A501X378_9GAMM|nr:flagellar basal body L-ring protein FlgH [Maribrevibacterium harenarium]TPE54924.1 flagellar basal body L-ring protein FlgH [Maribrevibacterium harenarium]
MIRLLALTVPLILAGCAAVEPAPQSDDPFYAPVIQPTMQYSNNGSGGIYQAGMGDVFFGDKKARRVGDILTVNLSESTSSSKSNASNVTKSSSATINNPTLFGVPIGLDTEMPGMDSSFSGSAGANQSNSLTGSITVTVYEVYPNGLLAVRGEKWITLNRGQEYIRLSGLVREEDIGSDNTVQSTRLADARIAYSGTGELAAGSEQGWMTRIMNSSWMPF